MSRWAPFTSLVSRANQLQESGEAAITAPKFISRSKEYTVQSKHTLHFFAALRGLGRNKKLAKKQELQTRNCRVHWPCTHTNLTGIQVAYGKPFRNHFCTYSVNTGSTKHKCMHIIGGKQSWESKKKWHCEMLGEKKKRKTSQVLGLALQVSLVLYLEYKQYRIRIVVFTSPFTISADTQGTTKSDGKY